MQLFSDIMLTIMFECITIFFRDCFSIRFGCAKNENPESRLSDKNG